MRSFAFMSLALVACASVATAENSASSEAASSAPAVTATPVMQSVRELCKLINDTADTDPSGNDPQHRANLMATDLGIPVSNGGSLYFFFGDSVGYKGIWPFGESQPDAVGVANAADVTRDPSTLCTQLGFLHLAAAQSIGPTQDATIAYDWAAVSMTPPAGQAITDYVHNPAGHGKFPNLTGDFEVPSGGFAANGAVYVFYTTVDSAIQMKGSYLAKWAAPDPNGQPNMQILYHVDERFDANGALGGDFINNAALVDGDTLYVYGTGAYRASPVHLAKKKLADLETPGGFEKVDTPIVVDPYIGELSVRYYPSIGRYMMLNQQASPTANQIVARFATSPEGPWSSAVVVSDMGDPAFRAQYCCSTTSACTGQQLMHCDRAGFYGTYLLPDVQTNADGSFTITYTMSTWDPYNVALMQATFR